jgi:hypothetical protein
MPTAPVTAFLGLADHGERTADWLEELMTNSLGIVNPDLFAQESW